MWTGPCFQSVLCFQSRITHSTILFYEPLPLNSFLFSGCTLLAGIQSMEPWYRRCLGPCRGGDAHAALWDSSLWEYFNNAQRNKRWDKPETVLQPSGQSQCSKRSSVGLVANLYWFSFAKNPSKSQRYSKKPVCYSSCSADQWINTLYHFHVALKGSQK